MRFPHLLTDYDLHLLNEGRHWQLYDKLGAQLRTDRRRRGRQFRRLGPQRHQRQPGRRFQRLGRPPPPDAQAHSQRLLGTVRARAWARERSTSTRSAITTSVFEKSDPLGFAAEVPPRTASKVVDLTVTAGATTPWMDQPRETNWLEQPLSFYEVHLGSWRRPGDDPSAGSPTANWPTSWSTTVKEMGYTHIELLPVSEHPLSASWGYQTVGYFAATSRYGTPQDFMYFVDLCHQNGIGVILDWVPAHFPRDGHGLRRFDGTRALRARRPAAGRAPRLGHADLQLRPPRSPQFPRSPTPCSGSTSTTSTGCASTPWPRCSTSTTAASEGEWIPNEFGGRENLEAIAFLKQFNEQAALAAPRRADHRRGIDRLARRLAADVPGRPGFQPEVEHGLDERHAAATCATIRSTASTITTS